MQFSKMYFGKACHLCCLFFFFLIYKCNYNMVYEPAGPGIFLALNEYTTICNATVCSYYGVIGAKLKKASSFSNYQLVAEAHIFSTHTVLFLSFPISHCHSHALRCTELHRCVLSSKCLRCRHLVRVGLLWS